MHAQLLADQETYVVHLKNKSLTFTCRDFSTLGTLDIEDLLQVDLNNIVLDIATFSVLFNRIALIKAEIDSLLRETQFDFAVFEAQKYEEHKKSLAAAGEKATETAVEMAIKRDPAFKVKKFEVFQVQKQADIVDGLYWSAKSKSKQLEVIGAKIKPEEFEIELVEGAIVNTVVIRCIQSQFPDRR